MRQVGQLRRNMNIFVAVIYGTDEEKGESFRYGKDSFIHCWYNRESPDYTDLYRGVIQGLGWRCENVSDLDRHYTKK